MLIYYFGADTLKAMREKYLHRNYLQQEERLQHEIGLLHLWILWLWYKIFPIVLLIPVHTIMYRNKQIFSENQRMERDVVVVTYRKEESSAFLEMFVSTPLLHPLVLYIIFMSTQYVIDTSWNIIRSMKVTCIMHTTMMGHMVTL